MGALSKQEFFDLVKNNCRVHPNWRYGQSVFNYVDQYFGVARAVQFKDGVDCFYNDNEVDNFLEHAYNYIKEE
jgi:hypothetical protein